MSQRLLCHLVAGFLIADSLMDLGDRRVCKRDVSVVSVKIYQRNASFLETFGCHYFFLCNYWADVTNLGVLE